MIYYLDPFGCAKNQVDAENMMALLDRNGWTAGENAEDADLIIVNSCGFIESAKQESINAVLGWRKFYPEKKILLAGCLPQRYAKELAEVLPEADGFFGVSNLAGIVAAAKQTMAFSSGENFPAGKAPQPGKRPLLSMPGSAYVKISEGCDNCCSFCAIPLVRGKLKSRSIQDLLKESKTLLSRGIKELCLIGQDTGAYGHDFPGSSPGLPELLKALLHLEGDFRVRLLYIHPDHFPLPILDIMERDKRFIPYFDIPFQHGSDKVLAAMNRSLTAASYLSLIETIRHCLPDAAIRSTFMTGFPGETEEDFAALLDFQEKASLDWAGCFAYSREENTPAYIMKGRVAKKTAAGRKQLVEQRQVPITERQMDRFIGRVFDVLVEERFKAPAASASGEENIADGTEEADLYLGRLPCQAPEVDGSAVIFSRRFLEPGSLVPCKVIIRAGFDLEVRPVG
jgi:ribosomal protein S12 methylthiotransferase